MHRLLTLGLLAMGWLMNVQAQTPAKTPAQTPSQAQSPSSTPTPAQATLPLFDAHIHYSHDAWDVVPTADVIALMRKAGLRGALVSSSNDDGTQKLLKAAPDLIIPSLRPYRMRGEISTWVRDDAVLANVEQRLRQYRYAAFGEFHLYGADAELPNVKRMMQLAVQNNLILHAHSDIDAVERLIKQFPSAKILWAHSGFDRPAAVAAMLRKHKQLWADLAYRSDMGSLGSPGKVDPDWAAVFKEFPERFMVGTDTFTPERLHYIPEHANYSRGWLKGLPPEIAERIAHRNAEQLLRPHWNANREKGAALPAPGSPLLSSTTITNGFYRVGTNPPAIGTDICASSTGGTGGNIKETALENAKVRIVYSVKPEPIKVGQAFSVRTRVCPKLATAKLEAFTVDAQMPDHKHGMNYAPKIALQAERDYLADGLLFHMSGRWQFVFELRIDGRSERLTQDVQVR